MVAAGPTSAPGSERWRRPPSPLRTLVACGWLTEAQAKDPRVRVDSLVRSHAVVRVVAPDGRAAIVKHPTHSGMANGRHMHREFFAYRLAGWMEAMAAVLPRAVLIDERRGILVLESLSTASSWPSYDALVPIGTRGVSAQLASAMARWFRATTGLASWPSIAEGVLHLPDAVEMAVEQRSPAGQAHMRALAADADIAAALRDARSLYRPLCLIHGDLRCDNWMWDHGRSPPRLAIFDWEMCGTGDPAWDIASVFAESVVDVIRGGTDLPRSANGWPAATELVVREFLPAYRAAAGPLDAGDAREWDRLVLFAAARLAHVACEWVEAEGTADGPATAAVLAHARWLLDRRKPAASLVRECYGG